MSYIEETLAESEQIQHRARFHIINILASVIIFIFLIIITVVIHLENVDTYYLIKISPSILGTFIFLKSIIPYYSSKLVLTNKRFILKTGVIYRKTEEMKITQIEEVNLEQSIMGRLMNYGTIILSGAGNGQIRIDKMKNPLSFMKQLNSVRNV